MCQLEQTICPEGLPDDQCVALVTARSPLAFVITRLFEYNAWQFCQGVALRITARFVHVNLVARNWQELARFYEEVLGCEPVLPERDLQGRWLEEGTGVPAARLRGQHLRLPGYGEGGPTLEIFQYEPLESRPAVAVNRPGLGHLAFAVDDVEVACKAVLEAGGGLVGRVVSLEVPGAGQVVFAYATDPEGNVIELQCWSGE
jgi:catechol 2,3-dioxygenase-like lactoylglutathione lyase family enzyme